MERKLLIKKLDEAAEKFDSLRAKANDPSIYKDPKKARELGKTLAHLEKLVEAYNELKKTECELREVEEILDSDDQELRQLAIEEKRNLEKKKRELEERLQLLLVPPDPEDDKNAILEIRAGTGGDEATLFAQELLRMYLRFAEKKGWRTKILELSTSDIGGVKEAVVAIEGKGAYSFLKYEAGVHRVQRVPQTESSGRIHTSAVTVAVLPEVDDIDVKIDEKDLRIDTFRASGAGGQHVNKTESAVRITHLPTGIVVSCQNERSQIKNRATAMKILRARLYELELKKRKAEEAKKRREMVKSGDRSEKVRTYNFPQSRVTDHRIGLTLYSLQSILDGDLDPLLEPLRADDRAKKLAEFAASN